MENCDTKLLRFVSSLTSVDDKMYTILGVFNFKIAGRCIFENNFYVNSYERPTVFNLYKFVIFKYFATSDFSKTSFYNVEIYTHSPTIYSNIDELCKSMKSMFLRLHSTLETRGGNIQIFIKNERKILRRSETILATQIIPSGNLLLEILA